MGILRPQLQFFAINVFGQWVEIDKGRANYHLGVWAGLYFALEPMNQQTGLAWG
jgi:hypothetical protein